MIENDKGVRIKKRKDEEGNESLLVYGPSKLLIREDKDSAYFVIPMEEVKRVILD